MAAARAPGSGCRLSPAEEKLSRLFLFHLPFLPSPSPEWLCLQEVAAPCLAGLCRKVLGAAGKEKEKNLGK